ncbi:hypothetical protein VTN02DRAFT_2690 [Thermoascus thermophilus]
MQQNESTIALIDNTVPFQPSSDDESLSQSPTSLSAGPSNLSKQRTRASIREGLRRRKYRKWQPERLGIAADTYAPSRAVSESENGTSSDEDRARSDSGKQRQHPERSDVDTTDFGPTRMEDRSAADGDPREQQQQQQQPSSQLDVLYENQRGWFFFGIPLYSHQSLLQIDPPAWSNRDLKDSPVDVSTAQVPDPSWEWAWKTWYVDMSGDVDEEGWQYSFSFASKNAWHGTHPWFHSFVRRRRWLRLRVKRQAKRTRDGKTGFEMAHMLNDEYFTIHPTLASRGTSTIGPTTAMTDGAASSMYVRRLNRGEEEEVHVEDIKNIPTLMHALKLAIVDREKIEFLKRFVEQGGEELYYLEEKLPEIMSLFVFQNSRWQFLMHLQEVIGELSDSVSDPFGAAAEGKDPDEMRRRIEYLINAAETARRHITGPDVFSDSNGISLGDKLDLTPATDEAWSSTKACLPKREDIAPRGSLGDIKGIPEEAEVGVDGHIF